mgnify:CR=1 FL=1
MHFIRKLLPVIFLSFLLTGCSLNTAKHLTQDEAKEIMSSNPDAIILDVRSLDEYEKKHIPKAVLLPIDRLKEGDFSKLPDKDATILVYCWTGRRAEKAANLLAEHGYKNVYDFGGLVDWTGEVVSNNRH